MRTAAGCSRTGTGVGRCQDESAGRIDASQSTIRPRPPARLRRAGPSATGRAAPSRQRIDDVEIALRIEGEALRLPKPSENVHETVGRDTLHAVAGAQRRRGHVEPASGRTRGGTRRHWGGAGRHTLRGLHAPGESSGSIAANSVPSGRKQCRRPRRDRSRQARPFHRRQSVHAAVEAAGRATRHRGRTPAMWGSRGRTRKARASRPGARRKSHRPCCPRDPLKVT